MDDDIDSLLVEKVSKPVAYFDADGFLIQSNRAWEMFCCRPSNALLIMTYADLVDALKLPPFNKLKVEENNTAVFNRRTIIIIRRRLTLKHTHGIMVEIDDITDAVDKSALIESTASDIMWKIRSRVTSVQNVLTLLVDYPDENYRENMSDLLTTTRREMWDLSRHIENMRDLTTINSGVFPDQIKGEQLCLGELLDAISIDCAPITNGSTSVFNYDLDRTLDFFSDRHICRKALSAIIFNALVYSDTVGPVHISAHKENRYSLCISISDTGWGIPHNEQDTVFSYGFRGARIRSSDIAGLGVELYLVRKMLSMIDSEIQFISKPGSGTQFDLLLRELR
jgi:K+-sensing histidine kinase KdpD